MAEFDLFFGKRAQFLHFFGTRQRFENTLCAFEQFLVFRRSIAVGNGGGGRRSRIRSSVSGNSWGGRLNGGFRSSRSRFRRPATLTAAGGKGKQYGEDFGSS